MEFPKQVNPLWFGVDVAKATFEASCREQGTGPIRVNTLRKQKVRGFDRTEDGADRFVSWIESVAQSGQAVHVVMESTGSYSSQLAFWLRNLREQFAISIINPRQIKHYGAQLGVRSKTDIIDARMIACYGAERQPEANVKKPSVYRELRSLSRCRESLVESISKFKQQSQEVSREDLTNNVRMTVLEMLETTISTLEEQLEQIDASMEKLVSSDLDLERDVNLLDSICGVGRIVAMGVLGEMGDLRDYHRSRAAASFAGLDPKLVSSGKYQGRTRMSKRGPSQVRRLLYLAVTATLGKKDNYFNRTFDKLVRAGKTPMAAIGALMRKMLTIMRAMLISNETYNDHQPAKRSTHMSPAI